MAFEPPTSITPQEVPVWAIAVSVYIVLDDAIVEEHPQSVPGVESGPSYASSVGRRTGNEWLAPDRT